MKSRVQTEASGAAESDSGQSGAPFRPLFWVDESFCVREWPEATARALRVPAREAVGRPCREVIGGNAAAAARCASCPVSRGASTADFNATSMGAPHGHCAIAPLPGRDGGAIAWLPFSEIVPAEAAGTRLEQLVARGVLSERLDSIADTLEGLRRVVAADDCELFLVEPSGRELFLVDCEGPDREAFMERTHLPIGVGYPGTVALLQRPICTNDFQHDRLFTRQAVKRRGIRSFIGVPLLRGGRSFGYVGVGWRDDSVPIDWGLRLLEDVKLLLPIALGRQATPMRLAPRTGQLVVRCFGTFEITCGGNRIAPEAFKRRKAVQLLKFLLLQRGAPVHRDRLVELLWPEAGARAGANRLHGVVTALRSALEATREPRASAYVVCRDDRYSFNVDVPHRVDVYDFLDLAEAARDAQRCGQDERAVELLEQALRLYRGDLFAEDAESADDDLFEHRRIRLRQTCLDSARMLAEMHLRRGRADEAIRILRDALEIDPLASDLHERLILLLARSGRLAEARQEHGRCLETLRRCLDMDPPARIRALEKLFR